LRDKSFILEIKNLFSIWTSNHLTAMGFTGEKEQQQRKHGPGNHQRKAGLISIQAVQPDSSNNFFLPF
jgi:hypothetical protein